MFTHLIEFFVNYFTNLNVKKIIGGILVLLGLAIIEKIGSSGDANKGILYFCGGLITSGVGAVIIYHDMGKDKAGLAQNDLELLAKAYEQKDPVEKNVAGGQVDQVPDEKNKSDSS